MPRFVALFYMLFALSCACQAANPPICPHVIGWNSSIATWAQGAPWIKVIYSGDIAPAKAIGSKVFYRPWDADSTNHDDGCLPASQTGSQYADLVWAKISGMVNKPDAVGYRNEFNWVDPTCSKRTCAQFPSYVSRLRTLGYTGKIIFGSFGVGWVDDGVWNDTDLTNAVNASDGVETHEYFDLAVNCGAPWLAFRHRDIALANHAYLQGKDWYIGEFGSDRCCNSSLSCSDPQCRRGWRDNGKLTEQAYIDQMAIYRAGCASQVVAVFVFQQGDNGPWADFEVVGTNPGTWMRSTWGLPSGRFTGQVKDTSGQVVPYPTLSVTPGLYGAITSNGTGNYTTQYFPTGTYDVTASKTGYASQTIHSQSVTTNASTIVNFSLMPLSDISAAKKQGDATTAVISGIVTARFPLTSPDRIYVQDAGRICGIAVLPTSMPSLADLVEVQGTMFTTTDGERIIKDATVATVQPGQTIPKPLGLDNLWLGGGAFGAQGAVVNRNSTSEYAKGLSNVGMLVHAWGKVSFVDPAGAYFYINDGAGMDDGSGHAGIRVAIAGLPKPTASASVDAVGISATAIIGGKVARLLKPRCVGDLSYAALSNYLANPGFESGTLASWTSYGRVDGAQSGSWYGGITARSGSWFFGNAANWDAKTGGLYQRVAAIVGGSYQAKAYSRVFWLDNSSDSAQSRVGIDPNGGSNPSAGSVVWSSVDTQPTPNYSAWALLTTPTVTCAGGVVTIFLDFAQSNPPNWHINCFDDAEVKLAP
jgi:hypothetical protein